MNAANAMPTWSADALEDWLVARIAQLTSAPPDSIDPDAPFVSLNLDSVAVMDIVVALEDLLGIEIESTIAWDYPTVRQLCGYIAALAATTTRGEPPC